MNLPLIILGAAIIVNLVYLINCFVEPPKVENPPRRVHLDALDPNYWTVIVSEDSLNSRWRLDNIAVITSLEASMARLNKLSKTKDVPKIDWRKEGF